METTDTHQVFDGSLRYIRHQSDATGTFMTFSVFVPEGEGPFPVLYWLSGLTCRDTNFTEKAGAYRKASELGLIIIAPDTSPRGQDKDGHDVPDDPDYDMGQGAGFYLDATQAPWSKHFRMETYVTEELRTLIDAQFPTSGRNGIFGHSMGGHGALTLAMRHPDIYKSVSAFAPIASPTRCPWGEKAMTAYLGPESCKWEGHDAAILIATGKGKMFDDILVDIGLADSFLETQLKPELLEQAAALTGQNLTLRRQAGYDHSYYFIQSFIDDHLEYHTKRLKA